MVNAVGFIGVFFKDEPSVARSESGGRKRHITVNSQNLREYASNNQTSGIHGTLYETVRNDAAPPCADFLGENYGICIK